jgi:hypothetical protein
MQKMRKLILVSIALAGIGLLFGSASSAAIPAPPVEQSIGMLDTVAELLMEADCRACHSSGVPDRHHVLYGEDLPNGSVIPYPDTDGDGTPDSIYVCMSCHGQDFVVERDCLTCHASSPHHTTQAAVGRQCTECHGDLVDDFDDGHYIPTYSASLVTPWRGLTGDGYANAPYPTNPDLESDGLGTITSSDVTQTEAGPPYYSINSTPLGEVQTRNQPNVLFYKPAGFNNDVVIGSTHHGGEEYSVVFNAGSPLAASWDAGTQTLSVTIDASQTALALVNTINAATGAADVEAELGYDGEDPVADLLPPEHYEPIGGDPPNNRGYGAGSCSYCHDDDGARDANGDPAPVLIVNNHDTHHGIGLPYMVSNGAGGVWPKCNLCHDYTQRAAPNPPTYRDQSGPAFDLSIRICEECHGPESLHNIQADSDGSGAIIVGGELAGYGHVGRDAGPGDSDCWGCHGFGTASAPDTGPIVPTVYNSNSPVIGAGTDAEVTLSGTSFTNVTGGTEYVSDVALTAGDGSSVTLTPDVRDLGALVVTIPGDTAPGNYDVRAVKADVASNPAVISVTPEVVITRASGTTTVKITGRGFAGHQEGSGTSVTGKVITGRGKKQTVTTVEAEIVSWSDTVIEADFGSASPDEVTVSSVFGNTTATVKKPPRRRRSR